MGINPSNNAMLGAGTHKMELNIGRKQFIIRLAGQYGLDHAEDFFKQYEKNVSRINPADYHIIIDCSNLNVFKPEILPYLEEAYKAYNAFKRITFINSPNRISLAQIQRIAKKIGLINRFEFVESEAEAQRA